MRQFDRGQRVKAVWRGGGTTEPRLAVVRDDTGGPTVGVEFTPVDAHWYCEREDIFAYGDRNGWTDKEYRVEREKAYCWERARSVERERRERYPDAPFSAYRGETDPWTATYGA